MKRIINTEYTSVNFIQKDNGKYDISFHKSTAPIRDLTEVEVHYLNKIIAESVQSGIRHHQAKIKKVLGI